MTDKEATGEGGGTGHDWKAEAEAFKAAALREHELMRQWQARAIAAEAKLHATDPDPVDFQPVELKARQRLTEADIERGKTANGGYTRAQLEEWGVSWPPARGWKKALIEGTTMPLQPISTATTKAGSPRSMPVSKDNIAVDAKLQATDPDPVDFQPVERKARQRLTEADIERGRTANGGFSRA